jgi:hypothetical protein
MQYYGCPAIFFAIEAPTSDSTSSIPTAAPSALQSMENSVPNKTVPL